MTTLHNDYPEIQAGTRVIDAEGQLFDVTSQPFLVTAATNGLSPKPEPELPGGYYAVHVFDGEEQQVRVDQLLPWTDDDDELARRQAQLQRHHQLTSGPALRRRLGVPDAPDASGKPVKPRRHVYAVAHWHGDENRYSFALYAVAGDDLHHLGAYMITPAGVERRKYQPGGFYVPKGNSIDWLVSMELSRQGILFTPGDTVRVL